MTRSPYRYLYLHKVQNANRESTSHAPSRSVTPPPLATCITFCQTSLHNFSYLVPLPHFASQLSRLASFLTNYIEPVTRHHTQKGGEVTERNKKRQNRAKW